MWPNRRLRTHPECFNRGVAVTLADGTDPGVVEVIFIHTIQPLGRHHVGIRDVVRQFSLVEDDTNSWLSQIARVLSLQTRGVSGRPE